MAIKTDPFLGLKYGDDKGADNWNEWTDANFVALGASTQIGVKSASTTPPAVVNGHRYIVPTGPSAGQIVAGVEGAYLYITPLAGWRAVVEDSGEHLYYDGTSWLDEDDYGVMS